MADETKPPETPPAPPAAPAKAPKAVPPAPPAAPAPKPAGRPLLPTDKFVMQTLCAGFAKGEEVTREQLGDYTADWIKRGIIKRIIPPLADE